MSLSQTEKECLNSVLETLTDGAVQQLSAREFQSLGATTEKRRAAMSMLCGERKEDFWRPGEGLLSVSLPKVLGCLPCLDSCTARTFHKNVSPTSWIILATYKKRMREHSRVKYRGQNQSGQAIKLFQAPRKISFTFHFLTQVFHPWWCETCRVMQQQFWMKECDIWGQNIPSSLLHIFRGLRPPTPRIYAPDNGDGCVIITVYVCVCVRVFLFVWVCWCWGSFKKLWADFCQIFNILLYVCLCACVCFWLCSR